MALNKNHKKTQLMKIKDAVGFFLSRFPLFSRIRSHRPAFLVLTNCPLVGPLLPSACSPKCGAPAAHARVLPQAGAGQHCPAVALAHRPAPACRLLLQHPPGERLARGLAGRRADVDTDPGYFWHRVFLHPKFFDFWSFLF